MAAKDKAGADAPAIAINGVDVVIDREAATSWDAFKLLRILNDEDADTFVKMNVAIAYAGLVSRLSEADIVEIAGGGSAQVADVMDVVAQIVVAASPKN